MSYTSSPYAAKARFEAARLVVKGGLKASHVARMYGVHRSTIGKWVKRFPKRLNQYGHYITTLSSAPNHHPLTAQDLVDQIAIYEQVRKDKATRVNRGSIGFKSSTNQ